MLSKLHSTCPKKKFEVKYFWFTKVLFFLKTSNIERTIFCPLLDFFWQRLQNCLLRVQKKILRRMRLTKKFSVFFGYWATSFRCLLKLVQSSCHHYNLHELGKILGKRYQPLNWKTLKLFSGVCQNRVLRVHRNILKQTRFSEKKTLLSSSNFLWVNFVCLLGKSWWIHQNCFLRVQRNFLGRITIFEEIFFLNFGHCAEKFLLLLVIFGTGSSKLRSTRT